MSPALLTSTSTPPSRSLGLGAEPRRGLRLGEVGLDRQEAVVAAEAVRQPGEALAVAVGDEHPGAPGQELARDRQADPGGAAGDEHAPAVRTGRSRAQAANPVIPAPFSHVIRMQVRPRLKMAQNLSCLIVEECNTWKLRSTVPARPATCI